MYKLRKELPKNSSSLLEEYFYSNGIEDVQGFIDADKENSPYQLKNLMQGINTVEKHIVLNSKIGLVVDCDQDGYTSAAIIWNYLHKVNPDINMEFHHQLEKQHGFQQDCMDFCMNNELVIMPDGGSNDYEQHKTLKDNGIDVVILDHHNVDKISSDAIVINSTFEPYPNPALSGAGVALKFCQGYDDAKKLNYADEFYDLAAIGIIGDMMPLNVIENRTIIRKGLNQINNYGLKTLIERLSYSIKHDPMTPRDVSFYITPQINSVTRVGTQEEKEMVFKAFIEGDKLIPSKKRGANGELVPLAEEAWRICGNVYNRQREEKIKSTEFIKSIIEKNDLNEDKIIFVTLDEEERDFVSPTLTGVIANELASFYQKPIILTRPAPDHTYGGSGRNISHPEFTDLQSFSRDSGYFIFVEGHDNAHGVRIKEKNIDKFRQYANKHLADIDFNNKDTLVDFILDSHTPNLNNIIYDFAQCDIIWGKEIEQPIFAIENIKLSPDSYRLVGKDGNTLIFTYNNLSYVAFKGGDFVLQNQDDNGNLSFTAVGKASINEWQGVEKPQMMIDELFPQ